MSKPVLFYDSECPVCRAFRAAIASYVGTSIDFRSTESEAKSFKYISADGSVFVGKDALRRLLHEFPQIAPALNILPEKWKVQVVNAGVQAAGVLRGALAALRSSVAKGKIPASGGCGCGAK